MCIVRRLCSVQCAPAHNPNSFFLPPQVSYKPQTNVERRYLRSTQWYGEPENAGPIFTKKRHVRVVHKMVIYKHMSDDVSKQLQTETTT